MIKGPSKTVNKRLKQQVLLLEKAERTGEALADVLYSAGWKYEDLIYEKSKRTVSLRSDPCLNNFVKTKMASDW